MAFKYQLKLEDGTTAGAFWRHLCARADAFGH